jgi:phosphopantetheine adenylyltransferase
MSCWKLSYDEQTYKTTGTIYNKETQLLAYADDIDIVGRSQSAVRDAYLVLEREAAKVGLKINEKRQNIWLQPEMIGRFVTWGKAWQLATNTLKSSKNLCT